MTGDTDGAQIDCLLVGRLSREYVLPPDAPPLLDSCGGSLAYSAGGFSVWGWRTQLLARVGQDFPRAWVDRLKEDGFDVEGIRFGSEPLELRSLVAYSASFDSIRASPVPQFAQRGIPFPKSLLGYKMPVESEADPSRPDPASPSPADLPDTYRVTPYVHLCPLDLKSQALLVSALGMPPKSTLSLDPAPQSMTRQHWRELRLMLRGVTAFQSSEEELRNLFWGETHDLWEMAAAVGEHGPQIVVVKRGTHGQLLFDAAGKHRWEVPAYPARLADPTGAGDAFCGGFLAGMQRTGDPLGAVLHGSVSASLKLEGSGPFYPVHVLPGLAEARLQALQALVRVV